MDKTQGHEIFERGRFEGEMKAMLSDIKSAVQSLVSKYEILEQRLERKAEDSKLEKHGAEDKEAFDAIHSDLSSIKQRIAWFAGGAAVVGSLFFPAVSYIFSLIKK